MFSLIKAKGLQKFGSIEDMWKFTVERGRMDDQKKNTMTLSQFQTLVLMTLKFSNLKSTFVRQLFDKMLQPGERVASVDDFRKCCVEQSLIKLKKTLEQCNRNQKLVKQHVSAFLRSRMFAHENTRAAAVRRFQKKITLDFTEELWTKIKDTMNRKSSSSSETQIDNWIVYIKSVHAKTQIVDVNTPNSRPNSQETGEKTAEQIAAEKEAAD